MKITPTWRVGVPQLYAALLLLVFLSLSLWRAEGRPLDGDERAAVETGRWLWRGQPIPSDAGEPPLTELLAAAAAEISPGALPPRLPTVLFGLALGASIWYVARRLYGNAGGYVALALYCFAPQTITRSARVDPSLLAAWGFFGVIFTAIGAAHTLHAPLANRVWRTLLLGLAIGLGTGAQFFVVLAVPAALAFMLYLVPGRRSTAAAMAAASLGVGFSILLAVHAFDPQALAGGVRHAQWLGFDPGLATLRLGNLGAPTQLRNLAGAVLAATAVGIYA
ncbi:MAG: glycosyltransferase family 39 protein, partial [Acidobacteriota bacterium]|nr:glycosyltransferase family 39 protein [Acidobacteriota bacterium]